MLDLFCMNAKRIIIILLSIMICFQSLSYAKQKKKTPAPAKSVPISIPGLNLQKSILPLSLKKKEQKPVPLYPNSAQTSKQSEEKVGLAVGIKAGGSAGLTGAVGDVSYSLSNIIRGAALRGSVGYLTGSANDNVNNLKMATVNLDAIYSISEATMPDSPVNIYVGGGLIYPWKVNNSMGAGAWGAHAYLGSKYSLKDSTAIYGELAYTGIKYQSDIAAIRGIEAMMGYSYSF